MTVLIDTNVFIRAAMPNDRHFAEALQSLLVLRRLGYALAISPQVLYEYWVVATRPKSQNGLAMSIAEVDRDLSDLRHNYMMLPDDDAVFPHWRQLVVKYQVRGKKAHDARLVAAMIRHGISHLLTFNEQDFSRFSEIAVISPSAADILPHAGN